MQGPAFQKMFRSYFEISSCNTHAYLIMFVSVPVHLMFISPFLGSFFVQKLHLICAWSLGKYFFGARNLAEKLLLVKLTARRSNKARFFWSDRLEINYTNILSASFFCAKVIHAIFLYLNFLVPYFIYRWKFPEKLRFKF